MSYNGSDSPLELCDLGLGPGFLWVSSPIKWESLLESLPTPLISWLWLFPEIRSSTGSPSCGMALHGSHCPCHFFLGNLLSRRVWIPDCAVTYCFEEALPNAACTVSFSHSINIFHAPSIPFIKTSFSCMYAGLLCMRGQEIWFKERGDEYTHDGWIHKQKNKSA